MVIINLESYGISGKERFSENQKNQTILQISFVISTKETITMKSSNYQNVLKFKKTSTFSENWFIESWFLNGSTAPIPNILVSNRFHIERNY